MRLHKVFILFSLCIIFGAIFIFKIEIELLVKYLVAFFLVLSLIWIMRFSFRYKRPIGFTDYTDEDEKYYLKMRLYSGIWILMFTANLFIYSDFGRAKYFIICAVTFICISLFFQIRELYFSTPKKQKKDLTELSTGCLIFSLVALSSISVGLYYFQKHRGMFFDFENETFFFPLLIFTSAASLVFLLATIRKFISNDKNNQKKL